MKKIQLGLICLLAALSAAAQGKKDNIDYYSDSEVKESRFAIDILALPNYTDRTLINGEVPSGAGLDLPNEEAKGNFAINYQLDLIYSIGSSLDLSVGFGYMGARFSYDGASYYENRMDTAVVNGLSRVGLYTIPVKLNFNTSMNDAFDLEVVPSVEMAFVNNYKTTFSPVDGGAPFTVDWTDRTQNINWLVGISLGSTFHLNENWGIVFRGNIKYMLNPLIERNNFPRETLYHFGINTGIRYNF